VHVDRDDLSAKFWLSPVALARNFGFSAVELRRIESLVEEHQAEFLEQWNGILALRADERVASVTFTADALSVSLRDGRTITVPLGWYPKLLHASKEQRNNWKIAGAGYGIHWPDLDEDLSTEGLLRGAPAPQRPAKV